MFFLVCKSRERESAHAATRVIIFLDYSLYIADKNKDKVIDILSKNVSDNKKLQKLQDKYQKEYEQVRLKKGTCLLLSQRPSLKYGSLISHILYPVSHEFLSSSLDSRF